MIPALEQQKTGQSWGMWGKILTFRLTDDVKESIEHAGLDGILRVWNRNLENLALALGLDMDEKADRRILTEIERRFAYNTARNGCVELRYQSPYRDGLYWKQVEDRVCVSRG